MKEILSFKKLNSKVEQVVRAESYQLYLKNGKVLTESSAVLGILSDLGGLWKLLSIFKLIPPFIRNAAYRFCAKRRYRVFGILDACIIPSSDWENRFLP